MMRTPSRCAVTSQGWGVVERRGEATTLDDRWPLSPPPLMLRQQDTAARDGCDVALSCAIDAGAPRRHGRRQLIVYLNLALAGRGRTCPGCTLPPRLARTSTTPFFCRGFFCAAARRAPATGEARGRRDSDAAAAVWRVAIACMLALGRFRCSGGVWSLSLCVFLFRALCVLSLAGADAEWMVTRKDVAVIFVWYQREMEGPRDRATRRRGPPRASRRRRRPSSGGVGGGETTEPVGAAEALAPLAFRRGPCSLAHSQTVSPSTHHQRTPTPRALSTFAYERDVLSYK